MDEQSLSATLYCRHGGSDKTYRITLKPVGGGWLTTGENGRRGSALTAQWPMGKEPTDYATARQAFDKVLKTKAKEYTEDERGQPLAGPIPVTGLTAGVTPEAVAPAKRELSGWYPQTPIAWDEDDIDLLIEDDAYLAQEKHNGEYRGITRLPSSEVRGTNKRGEWVELSAALAADAVLLPLDTFLVTEDLGDRAVAHDLLWYGGADLRHFDYEHRHFLLKSTGLEFKAISIVESEWGATHKRAFYTELKSANAEGMVFKRLAAPWASGDSADVIKVKFYALNCFVVLRQNKQRSVGLGAYDERGVLVDMGNCTIPVNRDVPLLNSPIDVRYLYAFPGGKLHQPTFDRVRLDARNEDCQVRKLKFVREVE